MKLRQLNKKEKDEVLLLSNFYNNFREIFYDSNTGVNKLNYYNAIPVGGSIIRDLYLIRKNFPLKVNLIDVGCGKGNIIRIANALNFKAKGIEYREEYRDILSSLDYSIGDAFDYKSYNENDIIYAFMPIANSEKMSRLLYYIDEQIKKDTLILFYGSCKIPEDWKEIEYSLYIKN